MAEIKIIPARDRGEDIIRTAAYARVSSDSEDQINSYNAQIRYYTEMLSSSINTVFVDMYADEGITGTSADKRDDFLRLMKDCRRGRIDRVLTKSVSRFARNTKECLEAVRELKILGISVYFEKENIDTGEISSEMMLAIYSQFAQEESISISKNCRMGIQKRMADGTYITTSAPYGYDLVDRKLVIDKNKAKVVKKIFEMYLSGKGTLAIANELNKIKAPSPIHSVRWHHTAIKYILENERYIGDSLYQKSFATDKVSFCVGKYNKELSEDLYETISARSDITEVMFYTLLDLLRNISKYKFEDFLYPALKQVEVLLTEIINVNNKFGPLYSNLISFIKEIETHLKGLQ